MGLRTGFRRGIPSTPLRGGPKAPYLRFKKLDHLPLPLHGVGGGGPRGQPHYPVENLSGPDHRRRASGAAFLCRSPGAFQGIPRGGVFWRLAHKRAQLRRQWAHGHAGFKLIAAAVELSGQRLMVNRRGGGDLGRVLLVALQLLPFSLAQRRRAGCCWTRGNGPGPRLPLPFLGLFVPLPAGLKAGPPRCDHGGKLGRIAFAIIGILSKAPTYLQPDLRGVNVGKKRLYLAVTLRGIFSNAFIVEPDGRAINTNP